VEAIVVADETGLEAVAGLPFADRIRTVLQAEPNLSRARNDGIAEAAGEIVAFLDDDAVPEPTWAQAIRRRFRGNPALSAVTGPVLGRDGISLQSGPVAVDLHGQDMPLTDADQELPRGRVLKLHGTNMAVRRSALLDVGGFDPALRFHLDASDLAVRLAVAGHRSAWLAGAQVHHARAASDRRSADLTPLGLHDIGASSAVFLRKHAPDGMEAALARMAEAQRANLFRLARKRKLGPRDIERLMADLRDGISQGRNRQIGQTTLPSHAGALRDLHDGPAFRDVVLAGWRLSARRLRAEARRLTEDGARVTILLLEPTMRAHRTWYSDGGWWEQTGGLFGRSHPDTARMQVWRFASRVDAEVFRLKSVRFEETPPVRFFDQ
jgi:GT2 family glycosyltransferase